MKKKKPPRIHDISGFDGDVFDLEFHDGHVFACSADKSARQYDVDKRNQIRRFSGHGERVSALDYNPNAKRLVTGSLDGEVRIWNTEEQNTAKMLVREFIAAPGYKSADSKQTNSP